ncbi:MAG: hypothetical protein M1838_002790 [Thelocarpon superellum]|nr:MAG: hypothetical protein M1838_002790 [Thelocarpon superellum]
MSTPDAASTTDGPPPEVRKQITNITFQFCKECSNMLYPKEDPQTATLMFACRTCQFSEPAASACVFRNILSNTVGETEGVTQDVASDPTVSPPGFCTLCGQMIACDFCGGWMAHCGHRGTVLAENELASDSGYGESCDTCESTDSPPEETDDDGACEK